MIGRCRDLEFAGMNVTAFMIVTPHFVHSILSGFGPGYGYSYPPVVVAPSPPPVYIQQQQGMPPQPSALANYYWHYCLDPEGYYPYVTNCPGGWLRVLPQPDQ